MAREVSPSPRVARLVRAYRLVFHAEATGEARRQALRARLTALLPSLTPEETAEYYAGVRRLRSGDADGERTA